MRVISESIKGRKEKYTERQTDGNKEVKIKGRNRNNKRKNNFHTSCNM
jgi:hypothetical protein